MLVNSHDILREFCEVRDEPNHIIRGLNLYTNRMRFILDFMVDHNVNFIIDNFIHRIEGHFSNIYVPVNGMSKGKTLFLMAHHDVFDTSFENANDNSASVAILLELIQKFDKVRNLDFNLVFVFTDSEENGFLGARKFAQELEGGYFRDHEVIHCINLELCGIGNKVWVEHHAGFEFLYDLLSDSTDVEKLECPINDAKYIRSRFAGYWDKFTTIGILPENGGELDFSPWDKIHTKDDLFEDMDRNSMDTITQLLSDTIISVNNK